MLEWEKSIAKQNQNDSKAITLAVTQRGSYGQILDIVSSSHLLDESSTIKKVLPYQW